MAPSGLLRSILVYGGDGWSLDLSSQFSPDIPEYGVIVPGDASNATLCVQPYEGAQSPRRFSREQVNYSHECMHC